MAFKVPVCGTPSMVDDADARRFSRAWVLTAAPIVRPHIRQTFHLAIAGRRQAPAAVRQVADRVALLPDVEPLQPTGRVG